MKTGIKILLAIIIIIGLSGCGKKAEEPKDNNNTGQPIDEQLEDQTQIKQGNLEFKDIKISSYGATNVVSATVINNGSKTSTFKAVLYMKNSEDRILGKVDKVVENLKSKESTKISIDIMGDYTTVTTFEVIVEDLEEK